MSGGIEKLIMMDTSYDMIKLCKDTEKDVHNENIEMSYMVGDEEFLPLKERCACNVFFFPLYGFMGSTLNEGFLIYLYKMYLWFEVL